MTVDETEQRYEWVVDGVPHKQLETIGTKRSKLRFVIWALIGAITIALLGAGYTGWWYLGKAYPDSPSSEVVSFTIEDGDTIESLSDRLYEEELVSDPGVFEWYVERNGGLEITPGFYQVPSGAHMGDVLERLRTPPDQVKRSITFPEGYTIVQIGDRLAEDDPLLTAQKFVDAANSGTVTSKFLPPGQPSLEGLLFPDTYEVSNADNEGQVAERMVVRMERVANQEDLELGAEFLGLTPYEVLTIASIIEREAKTDADRPKIARVIYNRLAIPMPLEIDATLYYGQPNFQGTFAELRAIDTPYNSYMHEGLPPTPIANPGRAAIRAALHPADNPTERDPICAGIEPGNCRYLYYVLADADGSHAFAATPEQHEQNVAAARAKGLL